MSIPTVKGLMNCGPAIRWSYKSLSFYFPHAFKQNCYSFSRSTHFLYVTRKPNVRLSIVGIIVVSLAKCTLTRCFWLNEKITKHLYKTTVFHQTQLLALPKKKLSISICYEKQLIRSITRVFFAFIYYMSKFNDIQDPEREFSLSPQFSVFETPR